MAEVTIAIATFRRPKGLGRLLEALAKLETNAKITLVVADNDAERHEGFDLCRALRTRAYRWPIDHFIVPERGIAQARNACIARALATDAHFIAMLDDDEWPEPGWLDAFLKAQQQTGADALHGQVTRVFEHPPAPWSRTCAGIASFNRPTGTIDMIESSSNVLMTRASVANLSEPWFDPAFALTGGEDRDFFTRMKHHGLRFAWAGDAMANAFVPASRLTFGWILSRAYRVGNSDMRVFLKYRPALAARIWEIAKIAGAALCFTPILAIFSLVPNRRAHALCKLSRAAGKTAALFGRHYNEYAVIHGE
ncbi:MAG TPA: glycosyltransferase [Rhizomicrobium sp.]|jgi:glycosyltransferase involved in cell wall biosynthesis